MILIQNKIKGTTVRNCIRGVDMISRETTVIIAFVSSKKASTLKEKEFAPNGSKFFPYIVNYVSNGEEHYKKSNKLAPF